MTIYKLQDRHTDAWATPKIDQSQDWFLLHGEEADQITILKFVRRLDTCDQDDKVIDVSVHVTLRHHMIRDARKSVFVVSDQASHKPTYTGKEGG